MTSSTGCIVARPWRAGSALGLATAALALCGALAPRAAGASCAVWTNLAPSAAPSPRTEHAMAYDSARDRVVLFSGVTAGVEQTSTWEYNPVANTWVVRTSSGPAAREGHALVYDSAHARTILFSGFSAGVGYQNATWSWNGTAWAVVASTGPSPRAGHAMCYDSARDRIVLFGGSNAGGRMGDTWEFNCATNVWANVSPASGPSARDFSAMAYDSDRHVCVLFGGLAVSGNGADTWEWDGGAWTQVDVPGPTGRYNHSMAYDAGRARTLLYGGNINDPNDLWEYSGAAWTHYSIPGPVSRVDQDMVYDSTRSNIIMFGGRITIGNDLADTWRLALSPWTSLTPSGAAPARFSHAMAEDSKRSCVLIYGGQPTSGPFLSDTWTLTGNALVLRATTGPGPRVAAAMSDDPARGQVLFFGGADTFFMNDTWAWRGPGVGWVQLFPATVPAIRGYHTMAYDPARDRVVMYAGANQQAVLGDTWEWDGVDWTQMFPEHTPPVRRSHSMSYDAERGRMVVYAGQNGTALSDTWEWDGVDWTQVFPAASPGQRYSHASAWNGARKRVTQFGGYVNSSSSSTNQTWEDTGDLWRLLRGSLPVARISHAMAYDSAKGAIVLFGGIGSTLYSDFWETRLEPAVVTAHPVSLSVYTGDLAQLGVAACGSGALSYQWRKNGSNLVDGDVVTGVLTPTLSIFPADPFDNGAYDCVVSNACAASTSAVATLLVTQAPPPCPADISGDGAVGAADLAQLLGSWGPAGGFGPADLNGDGTVNAADLAQLLGSWGPCP